MRRPASSCPHVWIGALLLVLSVACRVVEPESGSTAPSLRDLMRRYQQERRAIVIYGGAAEAASRYEAFGQELASNRDSWDITIRRDDEIGEEELGRTTVYLVGTSQSNRWINKLASKLPFQIRDDGFAFHGHTYSDPGDVLRLIYPNPANPEYPLLLTLGNSDEHLVEYLEASYRRRGDFQILRDGRTLAMGSFKPSGGKWIVDPENYRAFESIQDSILATEHFVYASHEASINVEAIKAIATANENLYRRVEALGRLGKRPTKPVAKISYNLYKDNETKGLVTDNTESAHYDLSRRELHAVLDKDDRGFRETRTAELLLRLHLGRPSKRFLERGLAGHLTEEEGSRTSRYWASRISSAGETIPLAELLDDGRFEKESSFIVDPLASSFVSFILEETTLPFFEQYSMWTLSKVEVQSLESQWTDYLKSHARRYQSKIEEERAAFPAPKEGFQKGFTHAHEGYQIYNGYLSKRSDDALAKLASFGTDSIAIVPYTFIRDTEKPTHLPIPRSPGSETDESVIHAIQTAKRLGMTVMLKPQIWMRGSWPGDIRMSTEEEHQAFFDHYYRWIRHYALMAELYQAEILCVGVELAQMTVGHEETWIEMIHRLRSLYSGRMVYAANWGREFESLTFWDHLDYIGVDAYYPLSKDRSPSDGDLRDGFARVLSTLQSAHERYKKPVLVTEIGFTSTPAPWRKPHERDRRKPVSLEDQALCYDISMQGLKAATSWIRGVYWWKWPSDLDNGGRGHTGFTPNGKPAENIVRKWYSEVW